MEHTITDLKWCKSQPDRVMVHVDGRPHATVSLVAAGRLSVGDRVDAARLQQWKIDQQRRDAYQLALRFLAVKDRSRLEVDRRLNRQGFDRPTIEAVVPQLMDKGYLDDEAYAVNYVNYRAKISPRSRRLMAQELKHKGIAAGEIETALKAVDERQLALACIHRKRRRWRRFEDPQRRMKIMAYLGRKGFSYDVSRAAVDTYHDQAD